MKISPGSCRAARGYLNWSQRDLANASGVSLRAIQNFENGEREPISATRQALQQALEGAGIEFLASGGVRLKHSKT